MRLQFVEAGEIVNTHGIKGEVKVLPWVDSPEDLVGFDRINMEVFCKDEKIGIITEVLDYPGNSVYVVKGEKTYMIPAVKAFILNTDMEGNRMDVNLLEGMETDAG